MIGALVGVLIGTKLGFGDVSGFDFRSFIVAIAGAMLFLSGFTLIKRAS